MPGGSEATEGGGRSTPGVGFATGIERITLNLKERGIAPDVVVPDLFIAPLGEAGPAAAMRLPLWRELASRKWLRRCNCKRQHGQCWDRTRC